MKRILILGSGAAGKSTFARALAERTGLPVVHLDSLYWGPQWSKPLPGAFEKKLGLALRKRTWIIDGSYAGTLEQRLQRADMVIYLDHSRWRCLLQVLKRRIQYRASAGKVRPGMPTDCPEQVYWGYLKWLWRYPSVERPKVLRAIAAHGRKVELVRLQGRRAAEQFLASF